MKYGVMIPFNLLLVYLYFKGKMLIFSKIRTGVRSLPTMKISWAEKLKNSIKCFIGNVK
jgi:hypothetical protein